MTLNPQMNSCKSASSWSKDRGQKVEPWAVACMVEVTTRNKGTGSHYTGKYLNRSKNKMQKPSTLHLSKSRVTECVCFYLILNSNSPTYPIPILGCYARNAEEIQDWSFSFIKFTFELPLKMIFHSTDLAEIYSRSRIKT